MEENFEVQDDSNDKKYFSLLPHYILNHSTGIDQALYMQIKRFAGENGICWASNKTLMEKMGIGKKALKKSFDYLLEHNWISYKGKKKVQTAGGLQEVSVYSVNDIWKLNVDFYQSKSAKQVLSKWGAERTPLETKGGLEVTQGGAERASNKNYINNINNTATTNVAPEDISKVIDSFRDINARYKSWFGNKTERASASELILAYGLPKVLEVISILPEVNKIAWMPTITSPYKLCTKWADLMSAIAKKKNEGEQRSAKKGRGFVI